MSSPTFTQTERRSYALPILLALAAIAVAIAVARIYFPATSIDVDHIHTDLLSTSTDYKSDSMLVGINQTAHVLFVASTIKITNHHKLPIFVDGFDLTLTDNTDAQLVAKGATKADLANMEISFPKLASLATNPLLRDTSIEPGQSVTGTLVFSLPIPKTLWDARKAAMIKIDIYHDHSVFEEIPKDTPVKP